MPEGFADADLWQQQRYRDDLVGQAADGKWYSHSLSGNERNRLFLHTGKNFTDISLLSGADDLADGRSWCRIDYDRDGYQDIALMSLSQPRFKLYHNNLKSIAPAPTLRIRLHGTTSNRDAIGAKITVTYDSGTKTVLHRQCGEGFASQNSPVLSVGIPKDDPIKTLEIRWPNGSRSSVAEPSTSTILDITES